MRKPSKAGIAILGILGALGFVSTLALPGVTAPQLVFLSTFDLPGSSPQAEVGDWVDSSTVGGITLTPAAGGGQEIRFDSNGLGGQVLYLTGRFADGQVVDSGHVQLTLRMKMVDVISPFRLGLIVDNPISDFAPATGPGPDGLLWIDQQPTSHLLPAGRDLYFIVDVWRATRFEDWTYTVSVGYELYQWESGGGGGGLFGSNYRQIQGSGSVEGSRLVPMVGLKLEKPAANVGIVAVDDVKVMLLPDGN
jgi:hypothetical protein